MINATASDTASISPRSWSGRGWPMTQEAWERLHAERLRLAADGRGLAARDGDGAGDFRTIELPVRDAAKRLERLEAVLDGAEVVHEASVVVIGRRVTLRDDDGTLATYAVVAPGEGDPLEGWISAGSPLGNAVLGHAAGSTVPVDAPAGVRMVRIEAVE